MPEDPNIVPIVVAFLGIGMWIPFINIFIGGLVFGTPGFWTGVVITLFELITSGRS